MAKIIVYPLQNWVVQQRQAWARVKARVKATPGLSIIANGVTLNTGYYIPKVGIAQNHPPHLSNGRFAKRVTNQRYNNNPYVYYPTFRGLVKALTKVIGKYNWFYVMAGNYRFYVKHLGCGWYCVVVFAYSTKPISKARVTKTVKSQYVKYRVPNPNYAIPAIQVAVTIANLALGLA